MSTVRHSKRLFWRVLALALVAFGHAFSAVNAADEDTPAGPASGSQAKIRIAVITLPNPDQTPLQARYASAIANAASSALGQSGRFDLIDRSLLPKVMDELQLDRTGLIDPSSAQHIGKLLGCDYFLYGNLDSIEIHEPAEKTEIKDKKKLDLTLDAASSTVNATYYAVKVETGVSKPYKLKGMYSSYTTGLTKHELFEKALANLCKALPSKLYDIEPLTGQVIEVNPSESFFRVDLGTDSGVTPDMIFVVAESKTRMMHGVAVTEDSVIGYGAPIKGGIGKNWSKLQPVELGASGLGGFKKSWRPCLWQFDEKSIAEHNKKHDKDQRGAIQEGQAVKIFATSSN